MVVAALFEKSELFIINHSLNQFMFIGEMQFGAVFQQECDVAILDFTAHENNTHAGMVVVEIHLDFAWHHAHGNLALAAINYHPVSFLVKLDSSTIVEGHASAVFHVLAFVLDSFCHSIACKIACYYSLSQVGHFVERNLNNVVVGKARERHNGYCC